jgi:hypothetical protein
MAILPIDSPSVPAYSHDVENFHETADRLAWLNDSDDNDTSSYPGVGWDAPRFDPSIEAETQEAGYARGYSLDWAAQPPGHLDNLHRLLWLIGKVQGARKRHADDEADRRFRREMEEWATAGEDRHPDETIRAIGCVDARREGSLS